MSTFFKKIQSFFSADFHGRYLGIILQEICELHPEILCDFFYEKLNIATSSQFTKPSFRAEYEYVSPKAVKTGIARRADLAVLDHGTPKVLIELKFQDHEIQGINEQGSQFEDYVKWTQSDNGRWAMVISLNPIDTKGMTHAYWAELSNHLKKYEGKSELADLLQQYLLAEKIALQNIEKDRLLTFLKDAVPAATNALKAEREKFQFNFAGADVCEEFEVLQNNLRILSMPCVRLIKSIIPQKQWQSIDHEVSSSAGDGSFDVLRVYSQHVLTGKPGFWCLRYGIELWEVNSDEMQCNLYSCVWDWAGTEDITEHCEVPIDSLTSNVCKDSHLISLKLHELIALNLKNARDRLNSQLSDGENTRSEVCSVLKQLDERFV